MSGIAASALSYVSETLNSAANDPAGSLMRGYQIYRQAQDPTGQATKFIKSSVGIGTSPLTEGAYPNDSCASIIVNAQNKVLNTLSSMINGTTAKAQTGFCSFASAISESLGNNKFCTTPIADVVLKTPVGNQVIGIGTMAYAGFDAVVNAKATECKFDLPSATLLAVTTAQAVGIGQAQQLAIGLTTGLVDNLTDSFAPTQAAAKIDHIQQSTGDTVFSSTDLANLSKVQNLLAPGSNENGGIAEALLQNINLTVNTIIQNASSDSTALLTALKTDLVTPIVTDVLAEFTLNSVNNVLPLSSQEALLGDVYDTYFGGLDYGNFSSASDVGYDKTINPYYGDNPRFKVTNDEIGETGDEKESRELAMEEFKKSLTRYKPSL
jgi:hypothetical protein